MRRILCVLWRRHALHAQGGEYDGGTLSYMHCAAQSRGKRLTGTVDLVYVRLENETALDDLGEDVVCLRNKNLA